MNACQQLNYTLASGLFVLHSKQKEDSPVITIFVTDLTRNSRVLLDADKKEILLNRDNVDISKKDVEEIFVLLEKKKVAA